jgi:hypothetical protein
MNIQRGLVCAAAVVLLGSAAMTYAQEGATEGPGYKIDSVSYEVTGRTKEWALSGVMELDLKRVFPDRQALDAYVADRAQLLRNQRVLDKATIEVQELAAVEGLPIPIHLTVITIDTNSVLALPKPQYDSNDGLLLSVRARDYNFLGTMQPLKLDLNYTKTCRATKIGGWSFSSFSPSAQGAWNTDGAWTKASPIPRTEYSPP